MEFVTETEIKGVGELPLRSITPKSKGPAFLQRQLEIASGLMS